MVKHFGYFRYQPVQLIGSPRGQKVVMTSMQFSLGWNFLQVLIFLLSGEMHFHIFVACIFSLLFFLFFVFSIFSNLRGSNPTAISKMSIIVSLKKL